MSGYTLTWFATAVLLGALLVAPLAPDCRISVVCATLSVSAAFLRFGPRHFRAALAVALVLSAAYASFRAHIEPQINETRTMRFSGTVLDERSMQNGLQQYQVKLDASFTISVSLKDRIEPGSRVVIRGRLEPFDDARNPGEPSQRDIERENGVAAHIDSATLLSVSPPARTAAVLSRMKAWALDQLRLRLGDPQADIVAGELWGERGALPPDLRNEFQETGTVHVLVTAGLHVGLMAAFVVWLCAKGGVPRAAGALIGIAAVWCFASFSGFHIPAIRAAAMATTALAARAVGRKAFSWNTLGAAAIVVLAFDPLDVRTASFWLSFCCVGSIFAVAPLIQHLFERTALPHTMQEALALTIATQLGTWPVTAAVFLQFAPYALLANIAVVPCVPITMVLGAAQLVASCCGPLAQAFANLNSWILAWTIGTVRILGSAPAATIVMTPAPIWAIAVYEASLIAGAAVAQRGRIVLAAGLLIVATSYVLWPPHLDGHRLRITVLDVGQADAIVIETPAHHAILVDSGGRLERGPQGDNSQAEQIGERIVAPFLIRQGIHYLDAIIISHPHGDHVGGCAPVLRKIRVAEIADGGQVYGGHAYRDCLDTANAQHVPIIHPRAGDVWRMNDGVVLHFIGPSLPFIGGKNAINDNSVAFILEYKHFRMVFTGDAGAAAERRFLDEGINLSATVLKVGHHGSAYSSTPDFIAAVHPRYAIVSVGRHNLFGHPAPSTIDTLSCLEAKIFRTDLNGATTVLTDGARENLTSSLESRTLEQ